MWIPRRAWAEREPRSRWMGSDDVQSQGGLGGERLVTLDHGAPLHGHPNIPLETEPDCYRVVFRCRPTHMTENRVLLGNDGRPH